MKILKQIISILCVCALSAVFTGIVLLLLIGAVKCASAIINDAIPTTLEYIGLTFVMLAGGVIASILFYDDTKDDDK